MYFPLFKRHGWGKRLGEGRRHNGAVMPYNKGGRRASSLLPEYYCCSLAAASVASMKRFT